MCQVVFIDEFARPPLMNSAPNRVRLFITTLNTGGQDGPVHIRELVKRQRMALPVIFQRLGFPLDTTASWHKWAGCSCGCNPAFVLDIDGPTDYRVNIKQCSEVESHD